MQSSDVLPQLLQPEIGSTRSWLSTTTSLATFVPGADRLANAATTSLGAVATMRDRLHLVAMCVCNELYRCVGVHVLILAYSTPHQHEHGVR